VSDGEWAFLAPSPALLREDAPQRRYPLRALFDGLRSVARTGLRWRSPPHDRPPWPAVDQPTRRRLGADVVAAIIADLRAPIQLGEGRAPQPMAAMLGSRTRRSPPERGQRAGRDGANRRTGTTVRLAIDALGDRLAPRVTPANAQARARVAEPAAAAQAATGEPAAVAYAEAGYTGEEPRQAAAAAGIATEVYELPALERGFAPLPRRRAGERDVAWPSRLRRLARDQERSAEVAKGLHPIAFVVLMWEHALPVLGVP
jgi:transposase